VVHQAGEGEVDTMGSPFLPWVHKHQDRPLVQVGPEFPVEKKKKAQHNYLWKMAFGEHSGNLAQSISA